MKQRGVHTLRDLKHLIRFEELLRAANNELVQQAQAEGKLALGYNCSYIPEVLLDVEGRSLIHIGPRRRRHRRGTRSSPSTST